jgi:hypothetical protein
MDNNASVTYMQLLRTSATVITGCLIFRFYYHLRTHPHPYLNRPCLRLVPLSITTLLHLFLQPELGSQLYG